MASKIAIIGIRGVPGNFPGSSGIDTYIEQLIPFFSKKRITLFSRSWIKKPSFQSNNVQTITVPCIQQKYLDTGIYSFLSTILAIVHQNDIFWYQAPGSCLLIKLAKLFSKKTVLTIHGIDWQRQKWNTVFNRWFLKSLESMAIKNADVCTGVSKDICQYVQQNYQKPCVLTPSSLIIQKSTPLNLVSQKFKINVNQPYILYLGRLVPEKKVEMLIKTYLKNLFLNQKYKLVIAGLIEKNSYCNDLIKLASQNSNIILTNYVTGQIKNELLSNCHLFVLPSSLEGNSLSLNEALGLNKLCLISDLPIHLQYQKQFRHITTFKTNSSLDFEKKIKQSLKKTTSIDSAKNNNWNKTAHIYLNIFKKI